MIVLLSRSAKRGNSRLRVNFEEECSASCLWGELRFNFVHIIKWGCYHITSKFYLQRDMPKMLKLCSLNFLLDTSKENLCLCLRSMFISPLYIMYSHVLIAPQKLNLQIYSVVFLSSFTTPWPAIYCHALRLTPISRTLSSLS